MNPTDYWPQEQTAASSPERRDVTAVDGMKSPSRDRIGTSTHDNKNWFRRQGLETKYSKTANWQSNENEEYISKAQHVMLFAGPVRS